MNTQREPIDFVVAWVDGSDPDWRRRKNQRRGQSDEDARLERYRDWGLLRYWFRGVERFTPWVRKVHFVCDQAVPDWLNTAHPKLHVVPHQDFIPARYLPTFSSHPIELNSFRIPGLSERFVYFCDDMFVIRPMKPEAFFRNGLPVDCAALNPLPCSDLAPGSSDKRIFYIPLNDVEYLNREYDFRACLKAHPAKWFHPSYGNYLLRNLFLACYPRFVGFYVFHLAQPYRLSAFADAWAKNEDILDETCRHPFRNDHDVSQSFIRYRQLAEGNFTPGRPVSKAAFHITEDNGRLCDIIRRQRLPMICLNDGEISEEHYERVRRELLETFESILPDQSRFENDA